jgi:hypothetical protein
MDWERTIERNREALERILAMILSIAGMGIDRLVQPGFGGRPFTTLPRHRYRAVLALLRPVEAAARRLIFVAEQDRVDARRLGQCISALGSALEDLPRQAARLARWQGRRDREATGGQNPQAARFRQNVPMRMGLPTDIRVLADLVLDPPDTS